MDRQYNPYPGDFTQYGYGPEFNFFSSVQPPAPAAATTMPGGDVTAPSTVSGLQAARDVNAGGGDSGGSDRGAGSGGGYGINSGGYSQSIGDMARDTLGVGRSMSPGMFGPGSIGATLAGAAVGLPGIGLMGSLLDKALGISSGARAGNPAVVGSGVPSQLALGAFLDRNGSMNDAELAANGLPGNYSYGTSPGGLAASTEQGMGLADKSAIDMANAGLGPMTAGQFGLSEGAYNAIGEAGIGLGQGDAPGDGPGDGSDTDAGPGADASGGGDDGGGLYARGGHVPALAQMASGGGVGRAAGRAHRDAPPIQTWIPDYMSETDPAPYLGWARQHRDNAGVARNIDDLLMRIEMGQARNEPVMGPIDPVPDRPEYARGGLAQMAHRVAHAGRFGDTQLAHVNPDELAMLRAHGALGTTNPETGLPENFGWKDILGIVAPVAGGLLGNWISPGIGGVIGAGLGGAAGGALTGGASGAIGEGLLSAGAAYGLQNAFPDTASALGMGSGGLGDMSFSGLGDALFGSGRDAAPGTQSFYSGIFGDPPTPGAPFGAPATGAGGAAPSVADAGSASGLTRVAAAGQPGADAGTGGGSSGGGVGSWLRNNPMKAAAALALVATMLGQNRTNTQTAQAQPLTPQALPASFTASYPQPRPMQRTQTPYTGDWYTYGLRPEHAFYANANPATQYAEGGEVSGEGWGAPTHASGGLIDGPGNGQSDDIPENAPADSYVVPADAVADLGDGSTEAGGEALDRALPRGGSGLAQAAASSNTGSASVPVKVSRGEYQVAPDRVAALGRGSADRGARRLDRMVKNIRRHRAGAGHPPRAKTVRSYLGDER